MFYKLQYLGSVNFKHKCILLTMLVPKHLLQGGWPPPDPKVH